MIVSIRFPFPVCRDGQYCRMAEKCIESDDWKMNERNEEFGASFVIAETISAMQGLEIHH